MINGYVGDLGPADGLQQGSTLVWWGDDTDLERGLDVGSRGRSSTSTSTSAAGSAAACRPSRPPTSASAAPARSASGVDYATGVRVTGDRMLSGVFGESSVASSTSRRSARPTGGSAARRRSRPVGCSPT